MLLAERVSATTLVVGLSGTDSAGAKSGTVAIDLASNGANSGLASTTLAAQNVTVSGGVFNLAAAGVIATPVNLGNVRVGGTFATHALSVQNTAAADSFTEGLDATYGAVTGTLTTNGASIANLAGSTTNNTSLMVGLGGTNTAGIKSGSVAVNLASSGANSGLADTSQGDQNVIVSGNVYQTASALAVAPVNFGIVHVGDSASHNMAVKNNAVVVAGFNDTLQATASGGGPRFTSSGNFSGLIAQATNSSSLNVALDTSTAGQFSGNATIALASHNSAMSDVGLSSEIVALSAQVNNYARASVTGGPFLSGSGDAYILDFGSIAQGTGSAMGNFFMTNSGGTAAYTDLMDGSFITTGVNNFTLTGLSGFTNLAGESSNAFSIALNNLTTGAFDQFVTFNYFGHNNSGYAENVMSSIIFNPQRYGGRYGVSCARARKLRPAARSAQRSMSGAVRTLPLGPWPPRARSKCGR